MATVELTWSDNSTTEDGFNIYRATAPSPSFPGDYTQIDSVSHNVSFYEDTNAPDGSLVYYAVTAFDDDGESVETTTTVNLGQSASVDVVSAETSPQEPSAVGGPTSATLATASATPDVQAPLATQGLVATPEPASAEASPQEPTATGSAVSATVDTATATPDVQDAISYRNGREISDLDHGTLLAPTSTGTATVSTGFDPDLILFTATNTIPQRDVEASTTDDYGWMHGASDLVGGVERCIFSGTGSSSTNGQATETDNTRCVNILELDADGNLINNRIQATVSATSASDFTLDFTSVGESEVILYKAYKFQGNGRAHVDFANARTTTGTQSITAPGFRPDFVKLVGQPRCDLGAQTVQDGNDWGISHGFLNESKQHAMAFASFSNNVDDHVWGGKTGDCLQIRHAESKGGATGDTVASGTITDSGFDLNYSQVKGDGNGEIFMYIAIEAQEGFTIDSINARLEKELFDLNGNYREISAVGNATINDLSSDGFSGGNQNAITYGWTHGISESNFSGKAISTAASSDSIGAHRYNFTSNGMLKMEFTDSNGNLDGTERIEIDGRFAGRVELEVREAAQGYPDVLADSHETNPIIFWGAKEADFSIQVYKTFTNTDANEVGATGGATSVTPDVASQTVDVLQPNATGGPVTVSINESTATVDVQNPNIEPGVVTVPADVASSVVDVLTPSATGGPTTVSVNTSSATVDVISPDIVPGGVTAVVDDVISAETDVISPSVLAGGVTAEIDEPATAQVQAGELVAVLASGKGRVRSVTISEVEELGELHDEVVITISQKKEEDS